MRFPPGSNVLFVGEGDFSFVTSLCKEDWCGQVSLVATCLQENLSERAVSNAKILEEKGWCCDSLLIELLNCIQNHL